MANEKFTFSNEKLSVSVDFPEKVAILVDGGFYQRRAKSIWGDKTAKDRAEELRRYCNAHVRGSDKYGQNQLYRIFYYDCPPSTANVYHPLKRKDVNLKYSDLFKFMTAFHDELRKMRKVALRLGKLSANDLCYSLTTEAQKKLMNGSLKVDELTEQNFTLQIKQKGVDMRIGLDIASMAYKKQVTQIILISGDSDFVPAAKLARREGIDFILDPMGAKISDDLSEHIDGIRSKIKYDPTSKRAETIQSQSEEAKADPDRAMDEEESTCHANT